MKKKFLSGLATAATAALLLSACGGNDGGDTGGEAGGDTDELREVTIGVLSIAPSVGVAYGIENGIFEEHGFDVTYEISSAGAAMLPAVSRANGLWCGEPAVGNHSSGPWSGNEN